LNPRTVENDIFLSLLPLSINQFGKDLTLGDKLFKMDWKRSEEPFFQSNSTTGCPQSWGRGDDIVKPILIQM
jgi:hypothetical protein